MAPGSSGVGKEDMTTALLIAPSRLETPRGLTYAERTLSTGGFWEGFARGLEDSSEVRESRGQYLEHRLGKGYRSAGSMLTRPESQPKLGKSERYALGLMLSPERGLERFAQFARPVNLCPRASSGCAAACLNLSGKGAMAEVQRARANRTAFLLEHPFDAGVLIGAETARAVGKYGDDRVTLRLNVLSDIRWELLEGSSVARSAGARLYDYTAYAPEARAMATDWHLTYSAKEPQHTPDDYLAAILRGGDNVAMPFGVARGRDLPTSWTLDGSTFSVIDGDLSDDRTEDPRGVIVGLRVKGTAGRRDRSGFIRSIA